MLIFDSNTQKSTENLEKTHLRYSCAKFSISLRPIQLAHYPWQNFMIDCALKWSDLDVDFGTIAPALSVHHERRIVGFLSQKLPLIVSAFVCILLNFESAFTKSVTKSIPLPPAACFEDLKQKIYLYSNLIRVLKLATFATDQSIIVCNEELLSYKIRPDA